MKRFDSLAIILAFAVLQWSAPGVALGAPTARTLSDPLGADRAFAAPGILTAPLAWMGAALKLPFRGARELPNSQALDPARGWTDLEFPVGESARGLYVEIRGRVHFERAEIRFADGSLRSLDLADAIRSKGLFQLAAFDRSTEVAQVRLRAYGLSTGARIGLRVGR